MGSLQPPYLTKNYGTERIWAAPPALDDLPWESLFKIFIVEFSVASSQSIPKYLGYTGPNTSLLQDLTKLILPKKEWPCNDPKFLWTFQN